jgi:hypothetical protein
MHLPVNHFILSNRCAARVPLQDGQKVLCAPGVPAYLERADKAAHCHCGDQGVYCTVCVLECLDYCHCHEECCAQCCRGGGICCHIKVCNWLHLIAPLHGGRERLCEASAAFRGRIRPAAEPHDLLGLEAEVEVARARLRQHPVPHEHGISGAQWLVLVDVVDTIAALVREGQPLLLRRRVRQIVDLGVPALAAEADHVALGVHAGAAPEGVQGGADLLLGLAEAFLELGAGHAGHLVWLAEQQWHEGVLDGTDAHIGECRGRGANVSVVVGPELAVVAKGTQASRKAELRVILARVVRQWLLVLLARQACPEDATRRAELVTPILGLQHEEGALALVGRDVLPRAVLHAGDPPWCRSNRIAESFTRVRAALGALRRGGVKLRDIHRVNRVHLIFMYHGSVQTRRLCRRLWT